MLLTHGYRGMIVAHRLDSLVVRTRVDTRTDTEKRIFLNTLKKVATVSVALEITGLSRSVVYDWRKEDAQFKEDWDHALEYVSEALESATYIKLASILQDNSKRIAMPEAKLIEMFLAGAKPDKYRQRGVEIDNSTNTSNLTIDWSQVPQEVFDAYRSGKLTVEDVYQQTLLINAQQKAPSNDEGA